MSVSLPSKPAAIVDVPEVIGFLPPQFTYNFFTPDETSNETGDPPEYLLKRPTAFFDNSNNTPQYARRLPRFVTVSFQPVILETDTSYAIRPPNDPGYIRHNLKNIVSEDNFTNRDFIGVNFEPVDFDKKVYTLVSGTSNTIVIVPSAISIATSLIPAGAMTAAAMKVDSVTSDTIPPAFLANAMAQSSAEGHAIKAHEVDPHEGLTLRIQMDARFVSSLVKTSLFDPMSTYNEDIRTLWQELQPIQEKAIAHARSNILSHKEFDPEVRFISIEYGDESRISHQSSTRVIGYVIDKWEVQADGGFKQVLPPAVIENPKANTHVDFRVKYGTEYAYAIRTIAEVKYVMPVEQDDGSTLTGLVTLLVSSRPTAKQYVKTFESVAPPPPVDLDFIWDYATHTLGMMWSLPVNTQRDIKKFQVFRRSNIEEPFELLRLFDFNDSERIYPDPENDRVTDSRLIKLPPNSPRTTYTDEDFTRDSSFIYAIASVDAHGLTSAYSQQFRISYNKFTNRLVKVLVSPSGAPKPYPNFYLLADTFADVMTGSLKQSIQLYFTPDALNVIDRSGKSKPIVETDSGSGFYRLQVMNTDVQKQRTVKVNINDVRPSIGPHAMGTFLGDLAPFMSVLRKRGVG